MTICTHPTPDRRLAVVLAAGTGVAVTSGTSSCPPQGQDARPPDPVVQRLPREPRAAGGLQRAHHHRIHRAGARRPATDVTPRSTPAASSTSPPTCRRPATGTRNTVTVAAGDIIGASPLLSAAFHDEPTIEAMNALGLDVTRRGQPRVRRGLQGAAADARPVAASTTATAQNNQNSCAAAHVRAAPTSTTSPPTSRYEPAPPSRTILPSYWIKKFNGAKVGFIGMTLKDTPTIVTAAGVAGLEFTDEVTTANALVPVLRKQGRQGDRGAHPPGRHAGRARRSPAPTDTGLDVDPTYDYTCGRAAA